MPRLSKSYNLHYDIIKNVLFEKISYGDSILIFYNNTNYHKQIFQNFMKRLKEDNFVLFCVSHKKNPIDFGFDARNFSFDKVDDKTIQDLNSQLGKCFKEVEENGSKMLLIFDWTNANLNENKIFLPFLEELLIKRAKSLNPPAWKRKYGVSRQKTPLIIINAFEANSLKPEIAQSLVNLHKRVFILQDSTNVFSLPTLTSHQETIFPKFHVLPQKVLEKLAKDNMELITLLLLEHSGKSGYQLLKNIANYFHCILSQGTLYPLLYQMEKERKITKTNGKGREIIYSLTQETKDQLRLEKEQCLKAYQQLANFFEE